MRGTLLLGMLLVTLGASAQATHHIDWLMDTDETTFSITINQGDIVTWTWADDLPHTVNSLAGGADTFSSGTITGSGETYSHTFANAGATNYKCNIHANMTGTITATAVAGIEDNVKLGFEYYPNPTTDILTINSAEIIDRIEIYDATGKQVVNSKSGNTTSIVHMAHYPVGTYYVKVFTASASKDITIVKN